jgi:hypothetical protein
MTRKRTDFIIQEEVVPTTGGDVTMSNANENLIGQMTSDLTSPVPITVGNFRVFTTDSTKIPGLEAKLTLGIGKGNPPLSRRLFKLGHFPSEKHIVRCFHRFGLCGVPLANRTLLQLFQFSKWVATLLSRIKFVWHPSKIKFLEG